MKVSNLKQLIQDLDDNMEVLVRSDLGPDHKFRPSWLFSIEPVDVNIDHRGRRTYAAPGSLGEDTVQMEVLVIR